MLLEEHVATLEIEVSLAFVLAGHDGIEDVAPARQGKLDGLDLLIEVFGQERLACFEFLQRRLDARLDARVFILDGKNFVLNRGQSIDGGVFGLDAVHHAHELLAVMFEPVAALAFARPHLHQLLLRQRVLRLKHGVELAAHLRL